MNSVVSGSSKTLTSILVDIDATATAQPALDRAADLAMKTGARLRIVDVLPADDELAARRRQLACIASRVRDVRVEAELLAGPRADALIEDVVRFGHDLLVRFHARNLVARAPE